MTKQELEQRIRSGIPITQYMDFRVKDLTDHSIIVQGGGAENVNVHGTAFAGSLYAVCTLALWGLVTSRLPAQATLVMAKADIQYLKPVVGDIVASANVEPVKMNEFLEHLQTDGKARLEATACVPSTPEPAAVFSGIVYSRFKKP